MGIRKFWQTMGASLTVAAATLISGCGETVESTPGMDTPPPTTVEKIKEKAGDALEVVGDKAGEVAGKAGEMAKDAATATGKVTEKAGEKIEEAGKKIQEATKK